MGVFLIILGINVFWDFICILGREDFLDLSELMKLYTSTEIFGSRSKEKFHSKKELFKPNTKKIHVYYKNQLHVYYKNSDNSDGYLKEDPK